MRVSHVVARLEQLVALSKSILNSYNDLVGPGLPSVTSTRIHTRLAFLKDDWDKFSVIHDAITIALRELSKEDQIKLQQHPFLQDDGFTSTKEAYLNSVEKMMGLLDNEATTSENSSSGQMAVQVTATAPYSYQSRLPRIDLPKFNGTPSDWLSFKDLFNSLVTANPSLSAVEKLQYLKTSIIGSAAPLLSNTTITADNFQKTWEALTALYENKRLLVNTALHSLLSLKRMSNESSTEMEQLYTKMVQIYRTLENLDRPVEFWDDFLIYIISRKLDSESIKAWEQLLGASKEPPKWHQFSEFMVTRFLTLQVYERSRSGKVTVTPRGTAAKVHQQSTSKDVKVKTTFKCSICSGQHYTALCAQYQAKSVKQKLNLIQKYKLCYNCLGNHKSASCRVTKRCQKCGRKHHTTIHQAPSQTSKAKSEDTSTIELPEKVSKPVPVASHAATTFKKSNSQTLLATAQIIVVDTKGNSTHARALIDQGSEISLISERLVQRLRTTRHRSSIPLVGIGAELSNKTKGVVNICIKPHFKSSFELHLSAHILPKLTSLIPSYSIEDSKWLHLKGLELADTKFAIPGPIDILLGADVYGTIIKEGLIKGPVSAPIAQNSSLGWIVSGPVTSEHTHSSRVSNQVSIAEELLYLLKQFWELDAVSENQEHKLAPEEQKCEEHFSTTYSRDPSGRYVVRLPFKEAPSVLGNSKPKAIRMIARLFQKFEGDPQFFRLYSNFMTEYTSLGHMKIVPHSEPDPTHAFYLPHHGVVKESSSTTKLRVVFNGSSKTSTGVSLNEILFTGPKLQNDLFNVLIWFRQFKYVFSADMEKMYRQIRVHAEDVKFQRVLWKDTQSNVQTYELQTVTYGLGCAPYLALRTVIQLVQDEKHSFPKAVPTMLKGRYVDDIFGGADSVDEAIAIAKEVNQMCMAGGFPLQKWASNHPSILQALTSLNCTQSTKIAIEDYTIVHSLGLSWNVKTDAFEFSFNMQSFTTISKRTILSSIAKLFDPLGLITPIIINAKILMQKLWSLKMGWDDPLPLSITTEWTLFMENLQDLPLLTFPRWIGTKHGRIEEIHGFSDASPQAIAAVVYSRWVSSKGKIIVRIICSKTKVAPLKRQTIPRLELAGAVLLTKLVNHLVQTFNSVDTEVVLWTDSKVTLNWINSHPSRWKDFVHNRVCFIQETLPQAKWRFVPGSENPADIATRGLTPKQLARNLRWWNGPSWLSKKAADWPINPEIWLDDEVREERRFIQLQQIQNNQYWDLLDRYSNLSRLLRITVWCRRVADRFKKQVNIYQLDPINTDELRLAKAFWVNVIQQTTFRQEFKIITEKGFLPASHPLSKLTPFIDKAGVLRVGGRLQASSLSQESKHPIILPLDSSFSKLIIADAHERSGHGGTQLTLSFIRDEFWILGRKSPSSEVHFTMCTMRKISAD